MSNEIIENKTYEDFLASLQSDKLEYGEISIFKWVCGYCNNALNDKYEPDENAPEHEPNEKSQLVLGTCCQDEHMENQKLIEYKEQESMHKSLDTL